MSASTLLANDLYRGVRRQADDDTVGRIAMFMVPVVALVAIWFTLRGGQTIVALLLMGYNFVTQLFPGVLASVARRNPATKQGVFAGIVVGVAAVAYLTLTNSSVGSLFPWLPEALKDLNVGIVALILNVVATVVVSAVTRGLTAAAPAARG
jgi:SSS family solute:Na+ symporter